MSQLPKLTELDNMGGEAWQSLMIQILQTYGDEHGFECRPGPTPGPDHGVDAFAPKSAAPALTGCVVFQAKWMWGELHKGGKKAKIEESFNRAAEAHPEMRHWVLVSPHDLTDGEQTWFFGLKPSKPTGDLEVHHWGHEQITRLMRQLCPDLFRRYYPLFAQADSDRKHNGERLSPYLHHLIELCRFVPLRGVRREDRRERGDPQWAANDSDKRLELERIFVDLDTTLNVKAEGSAEGLPQGARRTAPHPRGEEATEMRRLPALEAVAAPAARHVVLHGSPGCGKSTFVRFLVLALAHCGSGHAKEWLPRLPGWPAQESGLLPIRIELRHFAAWLLEHKITAPEPCHLWNHYIEGMESLQARKSWLDLVPTLSNAARAGEAIILLDGLDEVPGGKGKLLVRDCIERFAAGEIGRRCRIVVTCRTRSYDADYKGHSLHLFESGPVAARSPKAGAKTSPAGSDAAAPRREMPVAFELAPFDDAKIQRFIEAWYKALVELGEAEKDEIAARVKALRDAVCDPDNPKLGDLARIPLLLTVISHLHSSQRDLKLPDNRAELFHDLIDLLLTRWAERHQRRIETGPIAAAGETLGDLLQDPGVSGFELEHLFQLIAELAHDHYRGGKEHSLTLIPAETLRRKLKEQHHDPDLDLGAAWAERVMSFIQFRAGLLNSPDGGEHYDFPHSLLGEYLTAYHLARQRHTRELVAAKVTPDGNWDEVVRLVAGHHVFVRKETRDALDLAEELCRPAQEQQDAEVTDLQWRRVALAGDILSEMGRQRLERERHQGPPCRELVRALLRRLLQGGALPARDRARAGVALGQLGDERKGVGAKNGLPDIDWIEIQPGSFKMGEGEQQFDCDLIRQSYGISRYPATVAQYQAFIDEGGYGEERFWTKDGWKWKQSRKIPGPEDYDPVFQTLNHPRVGVSWYEAVAFCRWLSERLNRNVSLPSEAQWERAARHTDGRKFPWGGQDEAPQRCNMNEAGSGHTSAVGMFPNGHSQDGLADMAGNVWEWCSTQWLEDYTNYQKKADHKPEGDSARVLRGGAWCYPADLARCAYRYWFVPGSRYWYFGFRVVASPFFPLNSGPSEL